MEIAPFRKEYLAEAAGLFVQNFTRLRRQIPLLPDMLADPDRVAAKLDGLVDSCPVVAALEDGRLVGYLRLEGSSFGAADVVEAETTIAVTGEYVQPACRGRRLGAALLDAALRECAGRGYERCSVDFESFNPEAAAFWPKYFEPVCLSVLRIPEASPRSGAAG